MIFGKTDEQRDIEKASRMSTIMKRTIKFAWLPTNLTDGRWIWLEEYVREGFPSMYGNWIVWSRQRLEKKS